MYLSATISDVLSQNSSFWENQKALYIFALVFSIPIIVIGRYRIVFDFENRIITYVWYFLPKKKYSFDEITLYTKVEKNSFRSLLYEFYKDDKRIFHFSEINFQSQTKQDVSVLKEFLNEEGKFIYDIEKSIKKEGYRFVIRNYALKEFIGRVHFSDHFRTDKNMCIRNISVSYDDKTAMFLLSIIETEYNRDNLFMQPEVRTICEMQVIKEELKETLLRLSNEYNNIN